MKLKNIPIIEANLDIIKIKPIDHDKPILRYADNIIYRNLEQRKLNDKKNIIRSEPEQALKIDVPIIALLDNLDSLDEIIDNILDQKEREQENQPFVTQNKYFKITKIIEKTNRLRKFSEKATAHCMIQLAVVRSEEEGQLEWSRIQKKHSQILKESEMILKKMKYDEGIVVYLLLVGPYPNIGSAKTICVKLSKRQQDCILYNKDSYR
jgi:hypothetical protein